MSSEWFRSKGVVAAAVGAGILIGAAGILLFQQMMAEKKRLDRVASSVSLLRRELDTLKRLVFCVSMKLNFFYTHQCFSLWSTFLRIGIFTLAVCVHFSESKPLGSSSRGRPRSEARSLSDVDMFSTVSRLDEEEEDAEFFDLSDDEMIIQVNRYDLIRDCGNFLN